MRQLRRVWSDRPEDAEHRSTILGGIASSLIAEPTPEPLWM